MRHPVTLALTFAGLLAGRAASAHDLWLIPPRAAAPKATVPLRATQGMAFPEDHSTAPKLDTLRRAEVLGPSGARGPLTREGVHGKARRFTFTPRRAGLHVVGVDTSTRTIRLDGPAFDAYLVSDGMPHVYRARRDAGELGQPAHERYQKFVKALVLVGSGDTAGFDARLGQALEIVPLDDPFAAKAGSTVQVQVWLRGKPLPGAHLGWDRPHDGPEPSGTVRTDAEGRARIPIDGPGLMTVRLTHMERDPGADPEWSSLWTTLTFRAGTRPEGGRRP